MSTIALARIRTVVVSATLGAILLLGVAGPGFADEPIEVYVRSYDGAFIAAGLRKPAGDGPFPAVLFIHGGVGGAPLRAIVNGTRNPVPEHFYQLGYVVMSTDYRRYHFGDDEIRDVIAAYEKLAGYSFVDAERIGVIGGSHGGYLTMMLATRVSPAAAVSFAGLGDIDGLFFDGAQELRKSLKGYHHWKEKLLASKDARAAAARRADQGQTPQRRQPAARTQPASRTPGPGSAGYEVGLDLAWRFGDRRELYRAISPKDNLEKITCPLLYLVGGDDRLRFAGKQIVDVLAARGVAAEYSEHAGMGHGFYWGTRGPRDRQPQQFHDALKVTTDFISRHLRPSPSSTR